MNDHDQSRWRTLDEDAALRTILEVTAGETGQAFFEALVKNLAELLQTSSAWVTEYLEDKGRLRSHAIWINGRFLDEYEYDIAGTPCGAVLEKRGLVHYPEKLITLFPDDPDLPQFDAMSYMGMPLFDKDGSILGHLAVLDSRPLPAQPQLATVFQIFGWRAAAEVRRLRAEEVVREREQKLGRLVDSAMDGIVELDADLKITLLNPAARNMFGVSGSTTPADFCAFLAPGSRERLARLVRGLDTDDRDRTHLWIPGGLTALRADGTEFATEATLARSVAKGGAYYTLIIRNVNDRIEAERKIDSLRAQTAYLQEEIRESHNFSDIVGRSKALLNVLSDIKQVAGTDATVLITGETGTGKELIARAIHAESDRRDRPFIKVNCAAVPATLIESEFFGHESGAFTGATRRRDGRFALADTGTIFLDEIGELPLDLQAKLLRVLQEGEFEPVGSSSTHRVNVRVLAATNRDLLIESREGRFREDLYYRLNVFPIESPALRERREDIPLLAQAFVERFARKMGRPTPTCTQSCVARLQDYDWPGNVRELENVIERAMIISRGNGLNLDRALPVSNATTYAEAATPVTDPGRIHTAEELLEIERHNLRKALETARWKVSGESGAAKLLGLPPSTLSSRMKALGIVRPSRPGSQ